MYDHLSDRWETESESSWFIDSTASARLISISSNQDIFQFNTTIQSSSVRLGVAFQKGAQMLPKPATSSPLSARIVRAALLQTFHMTAMLLPAKLSLCVNYANWWDQHTNAKQNPIKRTPNAGVSAVMMTADDESLHFAWTPVASL